MKTILVVDDDALIRETISYALQLNGYRRSEAADGRQALEKFQTGTIDLLILDIQLPDMTGLEVCREIRKNDTTLPIIFITAYPQEVYALEAFDVGGDDFVRKPFNTAELMWRVKVKFKKSQQDEVPLSKPPNVLTYGDIRLNPEAFEIHCAEKLIDLTDVQFGILETLLSAPNKVFSRTEIMDRAYKDGRIVSERTIDNHKRGIRRRFRDAGCGDPIKTISGRGYKAMKIDSGTEI